MGIATNCQPTQKQFHGYCYKLSTPTKAVNSIHGLFDNQITMHKHTTYTTFTPELHTSTSTVAITHVCQLLYQELNARMAYMHVYTTRSQWQP